MDTIAKRVIHKKKGFLPRKTFPRRIVNISAFALIPYMSIALLCLINAEFVHQANIPDERLTAIGFLIWHFIGIPFAFVITKGIKKWFLLNLIYTAPILFFCAWIAPNALVIGTVTLSFVLSVASRPVTVESTELMPQELRC